MRKNLVRAAAATLTAAVLSLGMMGTALADEQDPNLQQTVTDNEKTATAGTKVEITHGHVDMGPRLIDGKWVLMARDDSGDTPTWRNLDDMVFVMDKPSMQTMPEGGDYDFVGAKSGESVWAIPQNEVPSTPWLGWNTQSPAVIEKVQGQVKLTYEGHQGDGQFTAFLQAGNFGKPQVLWTSKQLKAQPIHVDLNTHTHVNWVFTKPGVHLIKISASATLKDGKAVTSSAVLRFAIGDGQKAPDVEGARNATWHEPEAASAGDSQAAADGDHPLTEREAGSGLMDKTLLTIGAVIIAIGALVIVITVLLNRRSKALKESARAELDDQKTTESSLEEPSDKD